MKPAPSSIVSSNSTKLNTGTLPRFLIVENKAEVEALLKSRFAAQIYIETLPVPDAIAGDNAYDVLIWNSDNSTSHKAKGLEMLNGFPDAPRKLRSSSSLMRKEARRASG